MIIKELIQESASKICGVNSTTAMKKKTNWWNKEIKDSAKQKKEKLKVKGVH